MKLFTRWGFSQWSDSRSSILRTIYVLSHPVIAIYFLLQASVLTSVGDSLFNLSFVQSYMHILDHVTAFPRLYAEKASHAGRTYLFFSIAIASIPVLIPLLIARIARAEKAGWFALWETKSTQWVIGMLFVTPILLPITVMGLLIPGDPSTCRGCTTDSLLGLFIIYGVCAPIGLALTILMPVYMYSFGYKKIVTYLSRKKS